MGPSPTRQCLGDLARVTNCNVHRLMVDDGSVTSILYLSAYKKMGMAEDNLDPNSSSLYGFTGDHVIPKGVAKLIVTVEDHL